MNRHTTAVLHRERPDDNCLITSFLRHIFPDKYTTKTQPGYLIARKVADVRQELEELNTGQAKELSYEYLAAMEHTMKQASFWYVVFYKSGKPILFCYFSGFTLSSRNFKLEQDKSCVKSILGFFLNLKKVRVLVTGNGLRNEAACFCYNEATLSEDQVAESITYAAEKIALNECYMATVLRDMPLNERITRWLESRGYSMPLTDQVMQLETAPQWRTIDDYVQTLSRKYRARARKALAARDELEIIEITEALLPRYVAQMNRLFRDVVASQAFVLTALSADHFTQLKEAYGSAFEIVGLLHDGKLVAFYTSFVSDEACDVYYAGFDYGLNNEYQLYFNILFTALERTITHGRKYLKLGRTSFDAKASLGATPQPIQYMAKTSGVPALAARWFANYFSTIEDSHWKLRNPFSESQKAKVKA